MEQTAEFKGDSKINEIPNNNKGFTLPGKKRSLRVNGLTHNSSGSGAKIINSNFFKRLVEDIAN